MALPIRHDPPIITLTTDFGQQDGYVGAMQGVILTICPTATIVPLSHQISPQEVQGAAFVLYQAFNYYPPHTVHCVVVDPGVGSKRRAIAVRTSHGIFVGPDNGLFSLVLSGENINVLEAITLTNPAYQLSEVSATFHGRDIFAPAAAHIANGVHLSHLGPPAINLVRLEYGATVYPRGQEFESQIIHIDHFGNLILNLTLPDITDPEQVSFVIKDTVIESLKYTFADVEENRLLAYVGSTQDHIEIAVRNGNAAKRLNVQTGDTVTVRFG
jgi:hypothetical protein